MTRSDFQISARADWSHSIRYVLGVKALPATVWTDLSEIVAVLSKIMGSNRNHAHLPDGGGHDFLSVAISSDPGCLDFWIDSRTIYRMKPRKLTLEYVDLDPAESFFYLELDQLKPTGTYPDQEPRPGCFDNEELIEVSSGKYLPRKFWDDGKTSDGRKLPKSANLVIRLLAGNLMIVTKGSIWNGAHATYDGRHARMTPADIRWVIEDVFKKRAAHS